MQAGLRMDSELAAIIAEFESVRIGPKIVTLLEQIVRTVCINSRYPARYYSETGHDVWDVSGRQAVLNGWLVDRLLGAHDLERLIRKLSENPEAQQRDLSAQLFTSLRQYMATLRGSREASNLWTRLKELVQDSNVITAEASGKTLICTHQSAPAGISALDDWGLTRLCNQLTNDELNLRQIVTGGRATSPIENDELLKLIEHILKGAGGAVRLSDLHRAVAMRIDIPIGPGRALDASDEILPSYSDTEAEALDSLDNERIRSACTSALQRIEPTDARATLAYSRDPNFASVARKTGSKENTVRNRCRRAVEILSEELRIWGLIAEIYTDDCQTFGPEATNVMAVGLEALVVELEKEYGTE